MDTQSSSSASSEPERRRRGKKRVYIPIETVALPDVAAVPSKIEFDQASVWFPLYRLPAKHSVNRNPRMFTDQTPTGPLHYQVQFVCYLQCYYLSRSATRHLTTLRGN